VSIKSGQFHLDGKIAVVYTGFRERGTEARDCLVRVIVTDEEGLPLDFRTNAKLYADGRIVLDSATVTGQDVSGRGYLRAGLLDLTVYRQLTKDFYAQYDLRGRKLNRE
jgi:hypothetical protein